MAVAMSTNVAEIRSLSYTPKPPEYKPLCAYSYSPPNQCFDARAGVFFSAQMGV